MRRADAGGERRLHRARRGVPRTDRGSGTTSGSADARGPEGADRLGHRLGEHRPRPAQPVRDRPQGGEVRTAALELQLAEAGDDALAVEDRDLVVASSASGWCPGRRAASAGDAFASDATGWIGALRTIAVTRSGGVRPAPRPGSPLEGVLVALAERHGRRREASGSRPGRPRHRSDSAA